MKTLICNAILVNEGKTEEADVLISDKWIEKIGKDLVHTQAHRVIDAEGCFLFPGLIDDQVHFREPGLTHKGDIRSESRAAVAGGITSFMEMPNTIPPVFTQELLEEKFQRAAQTSIANYSFFMGASTDNFEEVMKTNLTQVCGLKIFMGSSTGNLLVNNPTQLEKFFSCFPGVIATHCEDEATIRANAEQYKARYGDDILPQYHLEIRSAEACYKSSSLAVSLAKKFGTRLNVLHLSTAREVALFEPLPILQKKITAEVCIHHLHFCEEDYKRLGNRIKWNPAVKTKEDREGLWQGLLANRLDIIATDHAPHTKEEKSQSYWKTPSGGPLVQHSLPALLNFYHEGKISLPLIAEKASHNPALIYGIEKRGFLREGYFADLVLANLNRPWQVIPSSILAKCGWSPFEGQHFQSTVEKTWVSGQLVYDDGKIREGQGERLTFARK